MAVISGTLLDKAGAVYNVKHPDFGAVGNGTTDDWEAIQDAIDTVSLTGGVVYFPEGRYLITKPLTLQPASGSHGGITFRGTSWGFGATPANATGSVIQFDKASGSALKLGPTTAQGTPLYHFTMYDLGIQATHASYSGDLVDARALGKCQFVNCGFGGLPLASSATAASLFSGNYWVDTHFVRCQFWTAVTGIKKVDLGTDPEGIKWDNSLNAVSFERCVFGRLTTSADIPTNAIQVWFDRCTFEHALSGAAAPIILGGQPAGGVRNCWFGDTDGNGTWLELRGVGATVAGNMFTRAAVGVELSSAYAVQIEGNHFHDCGIGVKAVSVGLQMTGNFFYLPTNGVALDLSNDTAAAVTYNLILEIDSATGTVGYKLASGTRGVLVDLAGSGADTLVQNNSGGDNWSITQGSLNSFAKVNRLVNTGHLELQGWLSMTGSAGSPASSTRFISDAGSADTFYHNVPANGSFLFGEGGAALLRLMKGGSADHDTSVVVLRRQGTTWSEVRVSEGDVDSGGTGYRYLRIPN